MDGKAIKPRTLFPLFLWFFISRPCKACILSNQCTNVVIKSSKFKASIKRRDRSLEQSEGIQPWDGSVTPILMITNVLHGYPEKVRKIAGKTIQKPRLQSLSGRASFQGLVFISILKLCQRVYRLRIADVFPALSKSREAEKQCGAKRNKNCLKTLGATRTICPTHPGHPEITSIALFHIFRRLKGWVFLFRRRIVLE